MGTVHQRFTQSYSGRRRVLGPLWQGGHKAKLVEGMDQLRRLVLYFHLSPVAADPGAAPAERAGAVQTLTELEQRLDQTGDAATGSDLEQ